MIACYHYLILLLLSGWLAAGNLIYAQEYRYINYNTKDGLAGSTVYGITQDRDGFIWFGTETGLSRFDGTHFKNFTIADGLPNNEVFGLYTDTKNRIWMICFKNAICYYSKGKIHNQQNDTILRKITLRNQPECIAENAAGDILFGHTDRGRYRDKEYYIITNAGTVQSIPIALPPIYRAEQTFSPISGISWLPDYMAKLPDYIRQQTGKYFSVSAQAAFAAGAKRYACRPYDHIGGSIDSVGNIIDTMIFFGENDRRGRRIPLSWNTLEIYPINRSTYAFLRKYNGVTLYNVDSSHFTGNYLTNYIVQYVMEDAEKNLWFSTKGSGIFKLSNARFKRYVLGNLGVRSIQQIKDHIYIGTDNGNYWSMPALQAGSFNQDTGYEPVKIRGSFGFIAAHEPKAYVNIASSDFLHLDINSPNYSSIKTLQLNRDTILVAASFGAYRVSWPTTRVLDTLYDGRTTCAYQQNGIYYIGTINGLYKIVPGRSRQFLGSTSPLLGCHISQITGGTDGVLWISTYERGIIGYKDGRIIAHIGQHNGLTSDICRCLFVSGDNLWAGTNRGLNKVDIRPGKYAVTKKFTETDGLNSDIINTVYCAGTCVYVGNPVGMTVFDEARMPEHAPSSILMTEIKVSGAELDPSGNDLMLKHRDNNIRFEYSGISFLSGGNITYRYRLLGLSDQWQTTKEMMLEYPSLPSGEYRLQLLAINKFGDKSPALEYRFEVKKLVWEQLWFQALALLLFIIFTVIIVRYRIRQTRLEAQEKIFTAQKLMELEQMALRAQMNPHFIFNCLNSVQHYILNQDAKSANFYLSRFAGLVRQTLDNSTKIHIPVAEEINYLKNYLELESLQLSGAFRYTILADDNIDQEKTMIPNMVLQPYVENAVKHGVGDLAGEGYIAISFHLRDAGRELECCIEDNGRGIVQTQTMKQLHAEKHQSYGMAITDKRIRTLNQLNRSGKDISVAVEDLGAAGQSAQGTRVTIRFPV